MTLPGDPFMLLSMINMKLRDEYNSLAELCATEDIDQDLLESRLKSAGFDYMPTVNQFR